MAMTLRIIAIIEIVCSFIVGCILGDAIGAEYKGYEYNWGLCVGIIVVGIINRFFILGFAEIIQKLDNTKK